MKKLVALVFIINVGGCAFTDATINVAHNPEADFSGPIQELDSLSFDLATLSDNRQDKQRIGWKKNGYGQNTADITSSKPVYEIVSNGIQEGLTQNGHSILKNGKVMIEGSVDKFWLEVDPNFWTIEFIGETQCSLIFVNPITKEKIYESTYSGTYSQKKAGGLTGTWEEIMSKSVDKLVEDIMFDDNLIEALENLK